MTNSQSDIRVAVLGASGRMGSTVCQAVEQAKGLTLVGGFDLGDDLGRSIHQSLASAFAALAWFPVRDVGDHATP